MTGGIPTEYGNVVAAAIARLEVIPRNSPLLPPLNDKAIKLRKAAATQAQWRTAETALIAFFDRKNKNRDLPANQFRNMLAEAKRIPLRSNGHMVDGYANARPNGHEVEPPSSTRPRPNGEEAPRDYRPDSYNLDDLGHEARKALDHILASLVTAKRDSLQLLRAIRAGATALVEFYDNPGYDTAIAHLQAVARDHYTLSIKDIHTQLSNGIQDGLDRRARDQAKRSGKQQRHQKRDAANDTEPGTLESAKASAYKMRAIRWFWPNRFALGKIGLIGGMPDRGKGQILFHMMARATGGDRWPCNEGSAPQGNAILLTAEDDIEDTVLPRLAAAGADLDRVEIVKMVRQGDTKRMFSLVDDLELLRQKIAEVGNVALIVIDPVSAYMGVGKMDSYRTTDVRGVLGPLKELAEETVASIIGVMHFNKKADVKEAMLRIADSLAYVAAARHCYVVVDDVENNRRLFVKPKNNVATDMAALSYTIDTKEVGKDEDLRIPIVAPYVVWGSDHVTITASEAMDAEAGKSNNTSSSAVEIAKDFLTRTLAMGPVLKTEIDAAAEANCIKERTLARAKSDLGIVARREGGFGKEGKWVRALPQTTPQSERRDE
jgi:hypothetical protein